MHVEVRGQQSGSSITSDIVADAGSETAPPGDNTPLKHLSVDAAGLHGDD